LHHRAAAIALFCVLILSPFAKAQSPMTIKLWPHGAPGTPTTKEPESVANHPELNGTRGNITRVTNITDPTLSVYAAKSLNSGAAIVVFPGGGYRWLSMDIEGSEVCDWFT
jgi:hypothetical protein